MKQKKSVLVKLDEDIYSRIKEFADKEMRPVSNAIVFLLDRGLSNPISTPHKPQAAQKAVNNVEADDIFSSMPEPEEPEWAKARTLAEVELPLAMEEELEYCQDPDARREIERGYKLRIAQAWNRYHLTKPEMDKE